MLDLKELILSLCGQMTVSGQESGAALPPPFPEHSFDGTDADNMGNRWFFRRCGRTGAPLLLIDAHFDEVGLVVTEVLENGFLHVLPVGSPDMRAIPAAHLTVYGREPVFAVAASTPPHLRNTDAGDRMTEFRDLLIDTGLSTERARALIRVGDRVAFRHESGELRNGRLYACGLDNRATAAIALYTAAAVKKEDLSCDLCVLLSAKEEVGGMGARAGAARLAPAAAIVLDSGFASAPDISSDRCIRMGAGTGLSFSAALDRPLAERIAQIAARERLPLQIIAENPATGTNADSIQFACGVPSALLSLPLSNMHTPVEVVSLEDAYAMATLLSALVTDRGILGGEKK